MSEIAIDRSLSIYGMLNRLNTTHQMVVKHRWTMNAISYEIENLMILDGLRGRVFASFQRMSRFLPQIPRYRQIAQRAESVYVIGIMDVKLPAIPNIHYIALPADAQLTKEWFVILDAPQLSCTLATEEISAINAQDNQRLFHGIWTFNPDMTTILQEWLSSLLNARPYEPNSIARDPVQAAMLMAQVKARLKVRADRAVQRAVTEANELQEDLRLTFEGSHSA